MTTMCARSVSQKETSQSVSWQDRYGTRHGFVRLTDEPGLVNGRRGRVTIYQRGQDKASTDSHVFILSWCWGGEHRKERVVGDTYSAVRRADEINADMARGPLRKIGKIGLEDLVRDYLALLERRAHAGEVAPITPGRYQSALAHLTDFARRDAKPRSGGTWMPNRDFVLRFRAYLQSKMISPNGHPSAPHRLLAAKGIDFIVASARSLVRWAVQDGLLPVAAADAFVASGRRNSRSRSLSAVPVTADQLIQMIRAADLYQLVLFSFHMFQGVRVAEPCWLMIEFFDPSGGWIDYRCIEELGYRSKGGVDKRLPVPEPMRQAIERLIQGRSGGPLLLQRRLAVQGGVRAHEMGLKGIIKSVQHRSPVGWSGRFDAAVGCLKGLGAIDGDCVRREFDRLAKQAGVPSEVTPKALRHYFATALERADVPYYTRKYLLGHRLVIEADGCQTSRASTPIWSPISSKQPTSTSWMDL